MKFDCVQKKVENFINNYYIFIIGFLFCLVGFMKELNMLVAILFAILFVMVKLDNFILFYLYFDIFSLVLQTNGIYNILFRFYQIVFICRFLILIYKRKKIITREVVFSIFNDTWFIILLFIGLIMYERNLLTVLSFLFFHIPILIIISRRIFDTRFKSDLLKFITYAGIFVLLWGLLHNAYGIKYANDTGLIVRMSYVSINPNISGYILLLSTISAFYFFPQKKYYLIAIILSIGLFSTVSVSAILVFILFVVYYLLKVKRVRIKYLAYIFILIIFVIFSIDIPIFEFVKNRISDIIGPFINDNILSKNSSGMERVKIYTVYLNYFINLPISNILFGGLDITKGVLLQFFSVNYNVLNSHCFIIDMLYGDGVIFLIIFCFCIIYSLRNLLKNGDYIIFWLKVSIVLIACVTKVYPSILFYSIISLGNPIIIKTKKSLVKSSIT